MMIIQRLERWLTISILFLVINLLFLSATIFVTRFFHSSTAVGVAYCSLLARYFVITQGKKVVQLTKERLIELPLDEINERHDAAV
jgi:hypothetical protein